MKYSRVLFLRNIVIGDKRSVFPNSHP